MKYLILQSYWSQTSSVKFCKDSLIENYYLVRFTFHRSGGYVYVRRMAAYKFNDYCSVRITVWRCIHPTRVS